MTPFPWPSGRAAADARLAILFRRDFRGLTGGHLKVWHYFRHALGSARYRPRIHLTPDSVRNASNPWCGVEPPPLPSFVPEAADALFLAGLDWEAVPTPPRVPVFNLIQGLGHARPGDPRRRFLSRPAVRICVSPEVADAILATGEVNGPVVTIPAGIDLEELPPPAPRRDLDLVVAGRKNPALAREVAAHFLRGGLRVASLVEPLERRDYLACFGRAEIVVPIPLEAEGFFLPALEAMAMGALVVCPDCIGNRSFCRDGVTSLRPPYAAAPIVAAVRHLLEMPDGLRLAMRASAAAEVQRHELAAERRAFLALLDGHSAS